MHFTSHHIMIDLETLGLRPGCSIIQLSAVNVIPKAEGGFEIDAFFDAIISRASNKELGLIEDPITLDWYEVDLKRSELLKKASNDWAPDIIPVLEEFRKWVEIVYERRPGEYSIWANGANFDFPILQDAYVRANLGLPWPYNKEMCFRTLRKLLSPEQKPTFLPGEFAHNALDDARAQARLLIEFLNLPRGKK